MSVFQTISQKAGEAGLPFLIIGGYAVMAHGFVRATDDLDLLVQSGRRDQWRQLLAGLGMKVYREAPAFMQFDPPPDAGLPVDLLLVGEEIFERMRADAEPASVGGASFGVVSLLHLIALKCHAIQHGKPLRRLKDTEDLIQLVIINHLDLNEPELRATILKHGNQELYVRNSMKNSSTPVPPSDGQLHDAPGLEFPDWSGMAPHKVRMTFEQAVRWNEEMLSMFPPKPNRAALDADLKCNVEFRLL